MAFWSIAKYFDPLQTEYSWRGDIAVLSLKFALSFTHLTLWLMFIVFTSDLFCLLHVKHFYWGFFILTPSWSRDNVIGRPDVSS